MKGDTGVIDYLNKVLANELTAIDQYFLHSRIFNNWGFGALAKKVYAESVDEMNHAQAVIDRILFLEGLPNMQDLGKIKIGKAVPDMLANDLALEMSAAPVLRDAIVHAEKVKDFGSRVIFREILDSEEGHIDWLETQLELIQEVSLQNYLQSQMD
ncbi:MAG: bacterioferritin [Sphingomonadales bacterium]